ncbi:dipeptide ABC transporter ATP-binding protein [Rhodobacteraceae bacterium B1Z28]|uniref:Dipeptide ABC transporter ATP-binding protein n=1 Tax=Ruegeria haliotis TaxID=2747601 RepID=A0ABX2PY21_9RHOB|nr:dipeptide ABC transporter ATP-binding protein [Ruegeria haliotis]NVO58535.1 dipeptide ABC transporter ATP-binding protein [Ruegeria haliotis]
MRDVILEARDLTRHFTLGGGLFEPKTKVRAVDGVSLTVNRGETFAIVGESGCGKSTLARLMMRLDRPTSGQVLFNGQEVQDLARRDMAPLRRDMQFVFQDPFSSLNPRMTVGKLVGEPLEVHAPELDADTRREKVAALLAQVGLLPDHANRYPHEFSGGQRQRIGIARALASGPRLLIGDEPVSALDVSVQAQVVNLLNDLKQDLDLTLVIIAHDLAVIRHMSDRIAVMYLGQVVESGPADQVFDAPRHPYTHALLSAIPEPEPGRVHNQLTLKGEMPSPSNPPAGCRFHTRCPFAQDNCRTHTPLLDAADTDHQVACHHWKTIPEAGKPAPPRRRSVGAEERFALYRAALQTTQASATHREETS